MLNGAIMIETTKKSAVVFTKGKNLWSFVEEGKSLLEKKNGERCKNVFFKAPILLNIKIN